MGRIMNEDELSLFVSPYLIELAKIKNRYNEKRYMSNSINLEKFKKIVDELKQQKKSDELLKIKYWKAGI